MVIISAGFLLKKTGLKMLNEVFSDCFAQKKNYLTEIDSRIKMLFVTAAIIITILSRYPCVSLIVFSSSLTLLLSIRIPVRVILIRLVTPLVIAGTIFFIQVFFYGETPIVKFNLWGVHFTGYKEGLLRGALIISKVLGTVSLVIFLSMTTPVNKLFLAARWFKVPVTWIEVSMLSYRYIFVLLEDAITVRDAQKVRLGYNGLARSLKSLGELTGIAVIRSYDRSVAAYEAMMLRGYDGNIRNIVCVKKFGIKDVTAIIVFLIFLGLLLVLNTLLR